MNESYLSDKVAVITGGGGGMGSAMTLALIRAGGRVAALDLGRDRLDVLAGRAEREGGAGRVLPLEVDVTSPDACAAAVQRAVDAFGAVHMLVNNAGIGMQSINADYMNTPVRFWTVDPDRWQRMMDVNFKAAFLMARSVAPYLIDQGWGRIVNVTTSLDTMIRGAYTPYGQSKAALEAATSSWAKDLEGTGVTCNVLVPGGPTNTGFIPEAAPFDRGALIQPEVMGPPIAWLASNDSDGVTDCRFVGRDWDGSLPPSEAAAKARAPAAWPDSGTQAVWPGARA